MKKGILLLLSIITIAPVNAKNFKKSTNKIGVNYFYNSDIITFIERGIKFHVFLNGKFDFDTRLRSNYYNYNGRRCNNSLRIERDYNGLVRRVGNVFVNYDYRGNVKRIGNVYMYYEFGRLSRVGNLTIEYDRWGTPFFEGNVKDYRKYYYYNDYEYYNDCEIDINIDDILDYDDVYFYQREFTNNYMRFKEDNHFFYYRANPNANIGKRNSIIRRRKKIENSYLKPEQTGKSRRNNGFNR